MDCERPYYKDINYPVTLYYAVFGADCRELTVSKEKHGADCLPEGLNLILLTRDSHREQMEEMIGGVIGDILSERSPELYKEISETDTWTVVAGTVKENGSLDYLRNTVGIIQALAENGAGVLDLLTISLFSPEEWEKKIFAPDSNLLLHTVLLQSGMPDGSLWLHSRGMLKFGRPDVSLENVPPEESAAAAQIANQLNFYGIKGAFLSGTVKLQMNDRSCSLEPEFINDFNNEDFNNAYYKIKWNDIKFSAE